MGKETGDVVEAGAPVIPAEHTRRTLVEIRQAVNSTSAPTSADETAAILRQVDDLIEEIDGGGQLLSAGTVNNWLVRLTDTLDKPQLNIRARQIKDSMVADMEGVATRAADGELDGVVAKKILDMRANYKASSESINQLKDTAVGNMFEKYDIDILNEDFGKRLLSLSDGQLVHTLNQIDSTVGKQYGDTVRAHFISEMGQRAATFRDGVFQGLDPKALTNELNKRRAALTAILPEGTDVGGWLEGMRVIEGFSRGRNVVANSAKAQAEAAILTAGSMTSGNAASIGFAGKNISTPFRQGFMERAMARPDYIEFINRLGRGGVGNKTVAAEEAMMGLLRLMAKDDATIDRKATDEQSRQESMQRQQQEEAQAEQGAQ